MFDLFRSRDKAVRILLGGLLVVVGFSMLTYLIPSYNDGSTNAGNDGVVAKIGGTTITMQEVRRLVQNTMRGRQIPAEIMPSYVPTIIDNMVNDRALAYQAQQLGFEVTDDQLRQAIQQMVPSLFPNGQFAGKETYAAMLSQNNISIAEFEADLRRTLLVKRMRDVAIEGTVVTPLEIEQEYRKKNEKIKIEYVKLTSDKYKKEVEPSVEEMQAYFKANAATYNVPERKNLAILIADQAKIEQSVNFADADLLRIYNQNQNNYRLPETVKVRHILFKTQGKSPEEEAKVKALAEDVHKQAKAGGDFAALVKKYSEDTASVPNGGVYTDVPRGQMEKPFEEAAFSLKVNEISGLVKTNYGYHIVQTLAHDQARLKPFEEVKGEIASQAKKGRVNEMIQQISDRAQAALQKNPGNPEKVAADFNLQLLRVDNYEPGKPLPEIGVSPEFDNSVGGLKQGEASQPVSVAGTKFALAVVTAVVPARPMTFDEAKERVRDTMTGNRVITAVQNHAKELIEKAKAMGDLAKAAKSMGLEVKTSDEITRTGAVEGLGSATYIAEGFSRPVGDLIGPIPTPDSTVVAKIVAKAEPDMSKLPEQRATIRDEIKSQKARDRNALFEAGLKDALEKSGKLKMYPDVINRLIAMYRTS
jgi:peptidyl-prolyl cis-trans isomerase D